jgi:hypothetical protein
MSIHRRSCEPKRTEDFAAFQIVSSLRGRPGEALQELRGNLYLLGPQKREFIPKLRRGGIYTHLEVELIRSPKVFTICRSRKE